MSELTVFIHLPGQLVEATLSTDPQKSPRGKPVLVLPAGGSYPAGAAFGPEHVTDFGLAACLILEPRESPTRPEEGTDEGRLLLLTWERLCADVCAREPEPTMVQTFLDNGEWRDGSSFEQDGRNLALELDAVVDRGYAKLVSEPVSLHTRIPVQRMVEGLKYGAVVTREDSLLRYVWVTKEGASGLARATPAEDEVLDSDDEIVDAIRGELDEAGERCVTWEFPDGSGVVEVGEGWDVFGRDGDSAAGKVVR